MAALMAAFQDLMDSTSSANVPFVTTYQKGRGKVMLVMILSTGLIFTVLYLTKQYFKLLKSSYHFGVQKIYILKSKFNKPKVEFIPLNSR